MESMAEEEAAKNLLHMAMTPLPSPANRVHNPLPEVPTSQQPLINNYDWHANKNDATNGATTTNAVTLAAVATKAPPGFFSSLSPPSDYHPQPIEVSSTLSTFCTVVEQPSSSSQRRGGRKRIRKTNYNTDSDGQQQQSNKGTSVKKGTRRSNGSKTVPADTALQLDEELLSKLPNAPTTSYFEEESAWRFHNPAFPRNSPEQLSILRDEGNIPSITPAVSSKALPPLPSPPPLPQFPSTGFCQWTFDETSRVLHAKFERFKGKKLFGQVMVNPEDEGFLLRMMERDDITVISEGLADEISASLWTREYITGCIGSEYHHKFRAFQKKTRTVVTPNDSTKEIEYHEEKSGWYSMKVSSYFDYLEKRRSVQQANKQEEVEHNGNSSDRSERIFSFEDSNGKEHCINAEEVSLVSLLFHVNVFGIFSIIYLYSFLQLFVGLFSFLRFLST